MKKSIQGRGALSNPNHKFSKYTYDEDPLINEDDTYIKTKYIETESKSVINKVDSPDVPMDYSLNPYQGCEHGCIYCYARNTHPYWGYSAGVDFESRIIVKLNAPKLLEAKLKSKQWKARPIVLSGNTDCYQPAERKYKLTRKMLELFWKYRHPVGIITKNSLILRDYDIIEKLQSEQLIHVSISLTSLDDAIRRKLEPRTATAIQRMKAIEKLSKLRVPVNVMFAPIIPSINDHEIFDIVKVAAELGAHNCNYTFVRLNGDVGPLFEEWAAHHYPDRKDKIIGHIKNGHGGQLNDSRFKKRMRGEGNYAENIRQQFKLAKAKYFPKVESIAYNLDLYEQFKHPQLKLF
ncbi:MAG: PA0069 family radical SAM protein [Bacteroidota bacterium]